MKDKQVNGNILTQMLVEQGYSLKKAMRLTDKVVFCGTLGNLMMDVADSFFKDEMSILRPLGIKMKGEMKFHYNEAVKASKALSYHLDNFTHSVYRGGLGIDSEDYSHDIYEIVKLIADHTKSRTDMAQIMRSIARRKCHYHIFEEEDT